MAVRAMSDNGIPRDQSEVVLPGEPALSGLLGIPPDPVGVVVFAHGSKSGRLSPRNNHVAARLRRAGLAILLLDLLSPQEEAERANVFDIPLLAYRLRRARDWLASNSSTSSLKVCYFGASTGAGAALLAAAGDVGVAAIVSRGGRPDLAGRNALSRVSAPTLLIVGSLDGPVIGLNKSAAELLRCEHRVQIVHGAGHLFEEPGTLDIVVRLAADWFLDHLKAGQ